MLWIGGKAEVLGHRSGSPGLATFGSGFRQSGVPDGGAVDHSGR
jgi:hypothetical protein